MPEPKHYTDFSKPEDENNTPFELKMGAEIKDGAPGNVGKALRIDSDGPFAILPGVDISPHNMPECTIVIDFLLESIPKDSRGWLLNHDNGGFDRCLALHDERFNGIGHGVGYKAESVYNEYTTPPIGEWVQMVLTYRQGGECAIFVGNDKAPVVHTGKNNKGRADLTIGRVTAFDNHWCDCWVKDISIFDVALTDEQVNELFEKFKVEVEQPKEAEPNSIVPPSDSINSEANTTKPYLRKPNSNGQSTKTDSLSGASGTEVPEENAKPTRVGNVLLQLFLRCCRCCPCCSNNGY